MQEFYSFLNGYLQDSSGDPSSASLFLGPLSLSLQWPIYHKSPGSQKNGPASCPSKLTVPFSNANVRVCLTRCASLLHVWQRDWSCANRLGDTLLSCSLYLLQLCAAWAPAAAKLISSCNFQWKPEVTSCSDITGSDWIIIIILIYIWHLINHDNDYRVYNQIHSYETQIEWIKCDRLICHCKLYKQWY